MATILVADDEPRVSTFLRCVFEDLGHTVLVAQDGFACLRMLEEHAIDLVVVDVLMPRMDGIEVLQRMRLLPDPPPTIAISGRMHAFERLLREAPHLGRLRTMAKPMSVQALRDTAGALLAAA